MPSLDSGGRNFFVKADSELSGKPVEIFSIEKQKSRLTLASGDNLIDYTRATMMDSKDSLPFFAELYNISANIDDYIMVPVIIMPSEIPNRNSIGFPFSELSRANPDAGCLAYQTWKNKPTFIDHNNKDYTKAKGIIFASSMRPIIGCQGNLWKVICLCGFDRTRDPILANSILTGERNAYSMGAWTSKFTCSICNACVSSQPEPVCEHVNIKKPALSIFKDSQGRKQLAYIQARNPLGFETSSVGSPAYLSATTNDILDWKC
jgi:hypothetical protein